MTFLLRFPRRVHVWRKHFYPQLWGWIFFPALCEKKGSDWGSVLPPEIRHTTAAFVLAFFSLFILPCWMQAPSIPQCMRGVLACSPLLSSIHFPFSLFYSMFWFVTSIRFFFFSIGPTIYRLLLFPVKTTLPIYFSCDLSPLFHLLPTYVSVSTRQFDHWMHMWPDRYVKQIIFIAIFSQVWKT